MLHRASQRLAPATSEILTPRGARLRRAPAPRARSRRRLELLAAPARAAGASSTRASCRTSCRDDARDPRRPTWQVAPAPADLRDRRCEITGPVDRKMMINALNSGASVFMADFEDALSPTWDNVVEGQRNLRDAVRRDDLARDAGQGVPAQRGDRDAPRPAARLAPAGAARARRRRAGLGQPVRLRPLLLPQRAPSCSSAAAGRTSTCRSWRATSRRGSGTTRSRSPRTSSASRTARSARTVLIETIPPRSRWRRSSTSCATTLPGSTPAAGTTSSASSRSSGPRLRAARPRRRSRWPCRSCAPTPSCSCATCHRRGAHAIGGMAAFIPSRATRRSNEVALAKVREDKEREVGRRLRRHLGRAPRPRPGLHARSSTACSATGRTSSSGCARTSRHREPSCSTSRSRAARSPRPACARTSRSALRYLDSWLRGVGRGGDRQPDGGRRDRRDLPLPALAAGCAPGASTSSASATSSTAVGSRRRGEGALRRGRALRGARGLPDPARLRTTRLRRDEMPRDADHDGGRAGRAAGRRRALHRRARRMHVPGVLRTRPRQRVRRKPRRRLAACLSTPRKPTTSRS